MIKGGYMGKMLRVDLSKQKLEDEALPSEEVLRKYVGETGLGLKYLFDEVPPSVGPLDPENRLIFTTGPLTGTVWPCSSRHSVVTINAVYPKIAGNSWGGGFWAARLKWAGYDGIIIQGKSSELAYLLIRNGKPELRSAGHLRGKDTRETEELVKKELGNPEASVLCIGPAGERCLEASIIYNDGSDISAHGGVGEVMGSKLLKAIAITGSVRAVPVTDAKKLLELALEYRKSFRESSNYFRRLGSGGIIRDYVYYSTKWKTAFKNYTDPAGQFAWAQEMNDTVSVSEFIPRPCFNCPMGCHQDIIVGKGPYKGYRSRGPGGGPWECAGMIGIMEGGTSIYLTDLLNNLGIDAATMGQKLGLLYECYERGLISKEFTDGLELYWGNGEAAVKLMHKYVNQEGIGKFLAKGQKEMAKAIGKGAEQLLGGYKGFGWHHDPRGSWEQMLGKCVSTTLATEAVGVDGWGGEPEVGWAEACEPFDRNRAPSAVKLTQIKNRWDNCVGSCQFSLTDVLGGLTRYTPVAVNLAVGWDFDKEEALLVGERVINIARVFNVLRGLRLEDDLDIGPRFLDGMKVGPYKDKPLRPHLKGMVKDYYGLMGWDPETGIPLDDTLKRVGLDELIGKVRRLRLTKTAAAPMGTKEESKGKVSEGK